MKIGVAIPIVGPAVNGAPGLTAFCRGVEELGYDTLWVGDRLITPLDIGSGYLNHGPQMGRSLDPVLLWTVAATATSRIRLNASTLSTFYYEPAHLARQLTTLDILSEGRLGVGVGLGWMKQEYDVTRTADWHSRGRMLDDVLAFLQAWWTTNPVSWNSEFFRVPPVHADLRPIQSGGPPIWIGGGSEAAMRRLGRFGVGWLGAEGLPPAGGLDGPDEHADRLWSVARRAAQDAGRDPAALKTAMRINVSPGTSAASLADTFRRYDDAGVDEAFFDAFATFSTLDETLEFAGRVVDRLQRS